MDFFRPIISKKPKPRKRSKVSAPQFKLSSPATEELFVGDIFIGNSLLKLPEVFYAINASIIPSSNMDQLLIILKDQQYFINLEIDSPFISDLFRCSAFNFKFRQLPDNFKVNMDIYLKTLPIKKSVRYFQLLLQQLLKMFFGIENSFLSEQVGTKIDDIDQLYKAIQSKQKNLGLQRDENNFKQPSYLKPQLRVYQEQAVHWMVHQERNMLKQPVDVPHPCYIPVQLQHLIVYVNIYEGHIVGEQPLIEQSLGGAILADEMGLGKTVEVLALILCTMDHEQSDSLSLGSPRITRQTKRKKSDFGERCDMPEKVIESSSTMKLLQSYYEKTLVSVLNVPESVEPEVACICGSYEKNESSFSCIDCGKVQHGDCVGFVCKSDSCFRCAQCWSQCSPLQSSATLIVCPATLVEQWINEIAIHVGCDLKVFHYDGALQHTPVYPTDLAGYDIVVTSYDVLQSEFHLTDQQTVKSLRYQRRYSSPGTPITCINWKRLCLDEAQRVENSAHMISELVQLIPAKYRWAVTGTPISTSIADIAGLLDALHVRPYDDAIIFNQFYQRYLNGMQDPITELLATVLWRTQKKDVLDQINIPIQTVLHYQVKFTQVEQYLYDCEMRESRLDFFNKLSKYSLDTLLISMNKTELKGILAPFTSLRRACVHHSVVKGRFLLTRKPVNSRKELLDALLARNINECEEQLRFMISALNGLAGVYLLLLNPNEAVEQYMKIQELVQRFSDGSTTRLSIDKLQLIHMYHNLHDLLMANEHLAANLANKTENNAVIVKPAELKLKQEQLEYEYMQRCEMQTKQILQSLNDCTEQINDLEEALVHKTWIADIVALIFSSNLQSRLIARAKKTLNTYSEFTGLSEKSHIIDKVMTWINRVNDARETCMGAVNDLYNISNNRISFSPEIMQMVIDCHLRPIKGSSKKSCGFCTSNNLITKYSKILFNETSEIANKQFALQMCEEEVILQTAVTLFKSKMKREKTLIEHGTTFLSMLDLHKKEFKELRKLWTYLHSQISSSDELVLCKLRLTLKVRENDSSTKVNASLKKLADHIETSASKAAFVNQIDEYEVDMYRWRMEHDAKDAQTKLAMRLGTNKYLQSLQEKVGEQQLDPCPICCCPLTKSWNMLRCGHAYCLKCLHTTVSTRIGVRKDRISCAVCRQEQLLQDINCVDEAPDSANSTDQPAIKGNCSSKVEHIIRLILQLRSQDAAVKILVFSSWISALKILKEICNENNIVCELIAQAAGMTKRLSRFKCPTRGVTVLLLPIYMGSKGLNLIEATHVIFTDYLSDPADEMQAVSRVYRIGQTKPTFVHKFIMENTIEEEIQRETTSVEREKWSKSRVTLGQIKKLFLSEQIIYDTDETVNNINITEPVSSAALQ